MTANQLSIILSNLNDQNIIIRYNNKELNIDSIELGIEEHIGTVYIEVKE